jgi:hypothetical protein
MNLVTPYLDVLEHHSSSAGSSLNRGKNNNTHVADLCAGLLFRLVSPSDCGRLVGRGFAAGAHSR